MEKAPATGLLSKRAGAVPLVTAGATALAVIATGTAYAQTSGFGTLKFGDSTRDGTVISSDQYLAPYGDRLVIDNGKIMSSTVSPDGTHLAASVTDAGV
ncbi:MAG TPA: hypothetical protein VHF26_15240, partial [Trebonia sp.]|nr:hypothetical protein [Trebonia sp.]